MPEAAEHRAALKVRLIVRDLSLCLSHKDLAIITSQFNYKEGAEGAAGHVYVRRKRDLSFVPAPESVPGRSAPLSNRILLERSDKRNINILFFSSNRLSDL